jgi:hypothetical protein
MTKAASFLAVLLLMIPSGMADPALALNTYDSRV